MSLSLETLHRLLFLNISTLLIAGVFFFFFLKTDGEDTKFNVPCILEQSKFFGVVGRITLFWLSWICCFMHSKIRLICMERRHVCAETEKNALKIH